MQEADNAPLATQNLSFESLKKFNDHGVEHWSARDLQPLLGYAKWQRFENALKKAIESCKMSGNNPDHHFTGSGKQIEFGKGAMQVVEDYHLSRFACYLLAQNGDPRKLEIAQAQKYFASRLDVRRFQIRWLLIWKDSKRASRRQWNSKLYLALLGMLEFKIRCSASSTMQATKDSMAA